MIGITGAARRTEERANRDRASTMHATVETRPESGVGPRAEHPAAGYDLGRRRIGVGATVLA
jgi:hypothetical protein